MTLFETLQALYDSEIQFYIGSRRDIGIKACIEMPGDVASYKGEHFHPPFSEQEIVAWLDKTARELYQDSEYAKTLALDQTATTYDEWRNFDGQ